MNRMYNFINYIYWKKEATKIHLNQDEMKDKLREVSENRKKIDGKVKTRRDLFTNDTYKLDSKGNYLSLYLLENDRYMIYTTNAADDDKNDDNIESPEEIFADKFKEINGLTLRKAFGYVDKTMYCSQISDLISAIIIYLCGFVLFLRQFINSRIAKAEERKAELAKQEEAENAVGGDE